MSEHIETTPELVEIRHYLHRHPERSFKETSTTAYLADVVSSSLLNGKKGNGIVTFLLFLALNWGISKLIGLIPSSLSVITVLLLDGAAALVLAAVMYVVTARLMEKYLSV